MEDKHIYDKVNLVDRYDLTVVRNDLEIKINNIDERVENMEERVSDDIVDFVIFKKDICSDIVRLGFDINKTNRKIDDIQKYLHLNIMCLDEEYVRLNKEMNRIRYIYKVVICFIFCLYLLYCFFQLVYFL